MEQKIIILYARPWDMIDENTGDHRVGVSIYYITADNMMPVSDEEGTLGYMPCKESVTVDVGKKITACPAVYTALYGMKGQKGKNVLYVQDILSEAQELM